MTEKQKTSTIALPAFIGMTCALVASVRNIPTTAAAGWTMPFYMLVAVLLFASPITLISGEYAGMFPGAGGPELWINNALGKRWGFVTSWLLWVQVFPGMVMVASVLAPSLAGALNMPDLAENSWFTFICILVVYWGVTLLNFKFDMAQIGGKIGVLLGLYIPMVVLFVLGFATLIKTGLNPQSSLGAFDIERLFPDSQTVNSLQYLVPIMFIFTGIEMSSVYITRLQNPLKTYFRGIMVALLLMAFFFVVNGFLLANAITDSFELDNIAQGLAVYCTILGLPSWFVNVFCVMVFIGVAVQLSAWATGPSKTITESARRGLYPPRFRFWKTNEHDVSVSVLVTQATVISLFALLYLLIPSVNEAFLLLVSATAIIYNIVYLIMGVGIIRLRKTAPTQERPFTIGTKGKGNLLVWLVTVVLFVAVIGGTTATLAETSPIDIVIELMITTVLFIAPLIIYRLHKESWQDEIDRDRQTAKSDGI